MSPLPTLPPKHRLLGPTIIKIPRSLGGHYYVSFRTAVGDFDTRLQLYGYADAVQIHYERWGGHNTYLIDWVFPGEEWREPTSGWRIRVNEIDCPGKHSVEVVLDTCPESWPVQEHESCRGASGASGQGYRGNINVTESGAACVNWLSVDYSDDGTTGVGNHTFCRNPSGSARPWCYINASSWEFCNVCGRVGPPADRTYSCATEQNILVDPSYRGNVSTTVTGFTCQSWSSQAPNEHAYTPESYPNSGLDGNACRNVESPSKVALV